jgi:hypothetical protein
MTVIAKPGESLLAVWRIEVPEASLAWTLRKSLGTHMRACNPLATLGERQLDPCGQVKPIRATMQESIFSEIGGGCSCSDSSLAAQ